MSKQQSTSHNVDWGDVMEIFGFDSPRQAQEKGMKKALQTVGEGGFLLLEGACGTGKTMLSLAPLLSLVRDETTDYKRIVVITSVKQQQKAFEDDIKQINASLPAGVRPISSVTLAGKADLNPYVREGVIDRDDVYAKSERLREETRELINTAQNPQQYARELAQRATPDEHSKTTVTNEKDPFEESDINYPYVGFDPENEFGYSPFYAQYTADKMEKKGEPDETSDGATKRRKNPAIPYNIDSYGAATVEDLLQVAGEAGTSPHAVMREAMQSVEVVVANYYHVFEPTTVNRMMRDLLDDETLLICDEAHNLVSKVRKLLGDNISLYSIEQAITELEGITSLLELEDAVVDKLSEIDTERLQDAQEANASADVYLQRFGVDEQTATAGKEIINKIKDSSFPISSLSEVSKFAPFLKKDIEDRPLNTEDLQDFIEFCEDLKTFIMKQGSEKVEATHGSIRDISLSDDDNALEIPLRDPEEIEKDNLTWWAEQKGHRETLNNAKFIGSFINSVYTHLYEDIRDAFEMPTIHSETVGNFFKLWNTEDNIEFFREVKLTPRYNSRQSGWRQQYKISLELRNCIPSNKIASAIDDFGGGILMSATLAPLDAYQEVTGMNQLASKRPVETAVYGLDYPEPNRISLSAEAPKFKHNRKGSVTDSYGNVNLTNSVRETYATALTQVVTSTPGNVLICMPSYSEAWWAGQILENHTDISKEILIDESSSNWETEEIKQNFFTGTDKVLVTSAYGTLIEGVDYEGDKLDAAVVCGVPLENSHSPYAKAVRTAYEDRFGKHGYEYAFTVPAVQKARQAIGRVVRGDNDKGVRVFIDERYSNTDEWDSVQQYLSEQEQTEFTGVQPDTLANRITAFWKYHSYEN